MTQLTRILTTCLMLLSLSSCYLNFTGPAPALAVKLDADNANSSGIAVCSQVLWVFASGDCGIHAAMKDGNITKVHHVDSDVKVIVWGIYTQVIVRVYGE